MPEVGIMSMQRICNYGSFLQAYGLKKILEELGCSVEFVDYHVGNCLVKADGNGIKRKIAKAAEVFKCKSTIRNKLNYINYKRNFKRKYFPFLEITEEMNYLPELDLLVVGSDEVFNCIQNNTNVGYSPELFGVDNRAKRLISYAASCGNTTVEKLTIFSVKDEVARWLKDFNALSVRDYNTGLVVKTLVGVEPAYHLDPVLIYDFIAKESIPNTVDEKDYMILYGYTGRFSVNECKTIRHFANKNKLKILCIGGIQHCCDRFVDCSPFEVISYFKNAAAVITDTFHGSILSIITHRNFAVFVRDIGYGNTEKLKDLMGRLKLEERIVCADAEEINSILTRLPIYEETDKIIESERTVAYKYLREEVQLCIQN